ncbi:hypothetical protein E0H26_13980 [Micromonospora zingiberis]|uniref:Lanthionine synthetase n=1 Tax=Micromonospora zingiberis TaxID=2053011 RepID=A0A4R0GH39_9ACTN|nr:hypothetical protein [Micromonospora zingiberis]TCB96734.1 hypothetical protein E0H26_13980 [Micromonospora zingiberis]
MAEADAARRLLRRLVAELRRRGHASPTAAAALALLASRLGHQALAASLTELALRGGQVPDFRVGWLRHRLVGECLSPGPGHAETLARTRAEADEVLDAFYRYYVEAGDVDLINGAGGVGMALWDLADEAARARMTQPITEIARCIMEQDSPGLYHGRSGGILLLRMLDRRYGQDQLTTAAVDALVRHLAQLTPAAPDTGWLGMGGVGLCYGQPGMLTALGPEVDPAVLARFVDAAVTDPALDRLDDLLGDVDADLTVCHGLAGLSLVTKLAPGWRELIGPDRRTRLAVRLAHHLDQTSDQAIAAIFDTPFLLSVLEGTLGMALTLAETETTSRPWWGVCVSLGDGSAAVAGGRAMENNR